MSENQFDKLLDECRGAAKEEVDEQESQKDFAGKFGVFGYDTNDENTWATHYDTEEEARSAALELARDLNGKDLAYVEVWQADSEGRFGAMGEPIWRRTFEDELAKEESKTKEDETKDN